MPLFLLIFFIPIPAETSTHAKVGPGIVSIHFEGWSKSDDLSYIHSACHSGSWNCSANDPTTTEPPYYKKFGWPSEPIVPCICPLFLEVCFGNLFNCKNTSVFQSRTGPNEVFLFLLSREFGASKAIFLTLRKPGTEVGTRPLMSTVVNVQGVGHLHEQASINDYDLHFARGSVNVSLECAVSHWGEFCTCSGSDGEPMSCVESAPNSVFIQIDPILPECGLHGQAKCTTTMEVLAWIMVFVIALSITGVIIVIFVRWRLRNVDDDEDTVVEYADEDDVCIELVGDISTLPRSRPTHYYNSLRIGTV